MKRLIMLLLTLVTLRSVAQEIAGRILDEKEEPMIAATVQIFRDGVMKGGITTDFDGNYSIKPLDPGYYDVLVIYTGYDSMMITRLLVIAGRTTTQNFNMHRKTSALRQKRGSDINYSCGRTTILQYTVDDSDNPFPRKNMFHRTCCHHITRKCKHGR